MVKPCGRAGVTDAGWARPHEWGARRTPYQLALSQWTRWTPQGLPRCPHMVPSSTVHIWVVVWRCCVQDVHQWAMPPTYGAVEAARMHQNAKMVDSVRCWCTYGVLQGRDVGQAGPTKVAATSRQDAHNSLHALACIWTLLALVTSTAPTIAAHAFTAPYRKSMTWKIQGRHPRNHCQLRTVDWRGLFACALCSPQAHAHDQAERVGCYAKWVVHTYILLSSFSLSVCEMTCRLRGRCLALAPLFDWCVVCEYVSECV